MCDDLAPMSIAQTIQRKINDRLSPSRLEVKDESHLHVGHAGAREGGESHFRLLVVSAQFEGLSRVARQRLINDILREELAGPVHALAMKTATPEEFQEEAAGA
jgi:BolA family transcriptional regulator, general stress-responsive regulator